MGFAGIDPFTRPKSTVTVFSNYGGGGVSNQGVAAPPSLPAIEFFPVSSGDPPSERFVRQPFPAPVNSAFIITTNNLVPPSAHPRYVQNLADQVSDRLDSGRDATMTLIMATQPNPDGKDKKTDLEACQDQLLVAQIRNLQPSDQLTLIQTISGPENTMATDLVSQALSDEDPPVGLSDLMEALQEQMTTDPRHALQDMAMALLALQLVAPPARIAPSLQPVLNNSTFIISTIL